LHLYFLFQVEDVNIRGPNDLVSRPGLLQLGLVCRRFFSGIDFSPFSISAGTGLNIIDYFSRFLEIFSNFSDYFFSKTPHHAAVLIALNCFDDFFAKSHRWQR
jgi:hypothetical protein